MKFNGWQAFQNLVNHVQCYYCPKYMVCNIEIKNNLLTKIQLAQLSTYLNSI